MFLEEFKFLIYVFRSPRNRSSTVQRVSSPLEVVGRGKKFIQLNLIYISFCAYTCDRGINWFIGLQWKFREPSWLLACVSWFIGLHVIENRWRTRKCLIKRYWDYWSVLLNRADKTIQSRPSVRIALNSFYTKIDFIPQLMHNWIVLKTILKFTLKLTLK
jgi:hypothetical protein